LILRKIITIAGTRCHISKLKYAPNSISAGAPPQTPLGAYSAPSDPLAGFKGSTSKGRGGEGTEGTEKEGKEREETIPPPFVSHFKPWT